MNPVNMHAAGGLNLDRLAAQKAQQLIAGAQHEGEQAKNIENSATKALGVLQENGIYAAALYLMSRPGDEQKRSRLILQAMLDLLAALPFGWAPTQAANSTAVLALLVDQVTNAADAAGVERLVLAKDTLEQMLIYTRYSAKAWRQESAAANSAQQPAAPGCAQGV